MGIRSLTPQQPEKPFRLQGGRHIANPDPTPMANLIASLGDVAGIELAGLENQTGRVAL